MSEQFLGEIRMFGGNYAPNGWAFCNGQLLSISQNNALFALVGTVYGGDGQTTFALPNLQGRLAVGEGNGPSLTPRTIGEVAGNETVTLTTTQLPMHNHPATVTTATGNLTGPANNALPAEPAGTTATLYVVPGTTTITTVAMDPLSIGANSGGNQPHDNMMPALCVSFIIALQGIFPSRN